VQVAGTPFRHTEQPSRSIYKPTTPAAAASVSVTVSPLTMARAGLISAVEDEAATKLPRICRRVIADDPGLRTAAAVSAIAMLVGDIHSFVSS